MRRRSTRSKRLAATASVERPRPERQPRRISPSGGRATPSRAGTTSPASSSHETISTLLTAHVSSRCRTWQRPTQRSTPGTTSTTSASGGRSRRSAGRRRTATPRPRLIQRGRRCSRRPTPITRRDISGKTVRTPPCCGCSSATHLRAATRSRASPSIPAGDATRSFSSFSQAVDEIVEARIWAGLHFRTADVQAVELGTNVANFAMENYLQ